MNDNYKSIGLKYNLDQMKEAVKNVNMDDFGKATMNMRLETPEIPKIKNSLVEEHMEKTEQYHEKSLKILESINANTANIYSIVELIRASNNKQDELIAILKDILMIAKARDKEEADSSFKKVVERINVGVDTADSMIKILGWATTIYQVVISMLAK